MLSPDTLTAAYELAIRADAVMSEPSFRMVDDWNRPHRAHIIAETVSINMLALSQTDGLAAIQQQVAELWNAVLYMTTCGGTKGPLPKATSASEVSSSAPDGSRYTVVCCRCKQSGHYARNFPIQKMSVTKSTAPGPSKANVQTAADKKGVHFYVKIGYKWREYKALWDTGCNNSVISSRALPDLFY